MTLCLNIQCVSYLVKRGVTSTYPNMGQLEPQDHFWDPIFCCLLTLGTLLRIQLSHILNLSRKRVIYDTQANVTRVC